MRIAMTLLAWGRGFLTPRRGRARGLSTIASQGGGCRDPIPAGTGTSSLHNSTRRRLETEAKNRQDRHMYALSLKQPWATLLAHAVKTIEVRKWPTARRG